MLGRLMFLIVLLGLVTTSSCADAESLEMQKMMENTQKALKQLRNLRAEMDVWLTERENECFWAIGHREFCHCIMNSTAMEFSFVDYVAITASSKEENGYDELPPEVKEAYDKVPGIRDACVAEHFGTEADQ